MYIIYLIAYLVGAIPFGLILVYFSGLGDVRSIGSGNIGATNVMRTGKKSIGVLTLLLDAGKGAVAVYLAYRFEASPYIAGACAIVGHMFPVWLKFKGGKGVATYLGMLLALNWIMGVVFIATWLITFAMSRISSLSALITMVALPIIGAYIDGKEFALFCVVVGILIIAKHKENIKRLLNKEE